MSFMVVNTGRSASRAFYLILNSQPGLIMPSRYALDAAVYVLSKTQSKLIFRLIIRLCLRAAANGKQVQPGFVFHSPRRWLVDPVESPRNIALLSAIRDVLDVDTVFFPVRLPKSLFLSELNRQMASKVGDWAFPESASGWRRRWNPADLLQCFPWKKGDVESCFAKALVSVNYSMLAESVNNHTGKMLSLYKLFSTVFNCVRVFRYEDFIKDAELILRKMSVCAGFGFTDLALVHAKLNGLGNRLLVYNRFLVDSDSLAFLKTPRSRYKAPGRSCRFRFEASSVIPICEDWGCLQRVPVECERAMPEVSRVLQNQPALAVLACDGKRLHRTELASIGNRVVEAIAPGFDETFAEVYRAYKEKVYFSELPSDLFQVFSSSQQQEYESLWEAVSDDGNEL